jgi:hypothetical protein
VSGFEDLRNTLAQTKHLTGEQKRGLLDNYVNAATAGDRQKAVYDAEGAIVHATAGAYGLTPQQARKLAEAGKRAPSGGSVHSLLAAVLGRRE